jgi:hypothetical protein
MHEYKNQNIVPDFISYTALHKAESVWGSSPEPYRLEIENTEISHIRRQNSNDIEFNKLLHIHQVWEVQIVDPKNPKDTHAIHQRIKCQSPRFHIDE